MELALKVKMHFISLQCYEKLAVQVFFWEYVNMFNRTIISNSSTLLVLKRRKIINIKTKPGFKNLRI